ncbi:MAG TPA: ATP-dependent zinc metalloprotease FtsH [Acetobacteraceae bacterium]
MPAPLKPQPPRSPKPMFNLWWMWLALFALMIGGLIAGGDGTARRGGGVDTIPYSEFQTLLDQGKVKTVTVSGERINGTLTEARKDGHTAFTTRQVPPTLAAELQKHGIVYSATPAASDGSALLSWIIPPLIFVGIWFALSRFMGGRAGGGGLGGLMQVGRSRAKLVAETGVKTTFADVAGVDEAKEELSEIVDFLKRPKEFSRLGAHIPTGILLVGPPGTGKTLLARAVAGEAGVPFFSATGSEFVEMFVGVGASRVRDLFEKARKTAPCIIFIDELDALGRARNAGPMAGGDEKEQTLNQLLSEMDGFERNAVPVIVLAATNRPEIMDPALLRAGRFDRQVLVDRADKKGRVEIFRLHLKEKQVSPDVRLEDLAALTPGFTGADIANLANEAAMLATRRGAGSIEMADFTEAVERIVAGLEKKGRILIPRERSTVAHHEMGHALVALAIPGTDPVEKISIIPRGVGALGYTMQHPTEDRFLMGRQELLDKMAVLLGGRAAEMLTGPDISTGAADDLKKATDIARAIVVRYGMDDGLGPVAWDIDQGSQFLSQPQGPLWGRARYSEETAHDIDAAVRRYLEAALQRALAILRDNVSALEQGAQTLLEHEVILGKDIPRPKPVALAAE